MNLVDVLFHGKRAKDRKVVESWRLYLSHLSDHNYPKESWPVRKAELYVDVLGEMAVALNYTFEKSQIKSGTYYPDGYVAAETDHALIRKFFLEVLQGTRVLPMRAEVIIPQQPPSGGSLPAARNPPAEG